MPCMVMTISKSQGQTLTSRVGVVLTSQVRDVVALPVSTAG